MRVETSKQTLKPDQVSLKDMKDETNADLQTCMANIADKRCKQSFAVVFKHFALKVKAMASRQLKNDALAAEVMQESMSQIWRKAHLYHPDKGASPLGYTRLQEISVLICFVKPKLRQR